VGFLVSVSRGRQVWCEDCHRHSVWRVAEWTIAVAVADSVVGWTLTNENLATDGTGALNVTDFHFKFTLKICLQEKHRNFELSSTSKIIVPSDRVN